MTTRSTFTDPQAAAAAEFARLADVLESLPDGAWDTPSLCAGWRVREVVAHVTMPARYDQAAFFAELQACDGDFTLLSNRIAERDGALPAATLVANLRDETLHRWEPPGGGPDGALDHAVIHALDATTPLGVDGPAAAAVLAVLDHLTTGGAHAFFATDLDGVQLTATDEQWTFGSGPRAVTGTAADLVLWISGRQLPPGRVAVRP
jgi:uncharacterized protein (TIGR03083 family)